MKQYSYDELKKEVEFRKKEKSDWLGKCCNCCTDILKKDIRQQFKAATEQYCCFKCSTYIDEVIILCYLINCARGLRDWKTLNSLNKNKEEENV